MKKTYIIIIAILFGVIQNSFSQNLDELVDIISNESKGTYLKDFKITIEPNAEARFSVILLKNTKYGFSIYQGNPNHVEFNLFRGKKEGQRITFTQSKKNARIEESNVESNFVVDESTSPLAPFNIDANKKIVSQEYIISETGVYHLFLNNHSDKQIETVVLLTFIDKAPFKGKDGELIIPITKQEENQNQTKLENAEKDKNYFFVVENMPMFNGKDKYREEFTKFLNQKIKYPQEAIDKRIGGRIFVQFIIDKNGYIKNAKVLKGVHPSLDQEALRIIYSSPKWEPGTQKGKAVDVMLTFPIDFKLPE